MNILAICGSPHKKGNTWSVLNAIKENYPNIDFKLLALTEVNLKPCLGCYMCVRRGPEVCPLKDDRDMIVQEMLDADGIILASSVYVNHSTALMKNFIERVGYEGHRPRFYEKFAMVIAVCGMFGAKEANKYMGDILTSFGFDVVSSLELQIALKTEKENAYNHKKIVKAYDKFVATIEKGKRNAPPLGQLVRFNIFKMISEANKEHFEADYAYYKDKTSIPYNGRIGFFKTMRAKMKALKTMGVFMMHR